MATGFALFLSVSACVAADRITARSPDQEAAACSGLSGLTLADGGEVTEATLVPAGVLRISDTVTVPDLPAFCRVQGVSRPTTDSRIRFEVWMPLGAGWNQKFLSTGEGGFAGQVRYGGTGTDGALDENLRRGYATASTDTGHTSGDLYFAIGHPERGADYLVRAKHVTTVAAKAIIAAYYGQPPSRSYFSSCSNGGREGLVEAQIYPDDFDGLIIGAPWNDQSRSTVAHLWMRQFLSLPEETIPPEKLPAIHAAVLKACDHADGLIDGVIGNPEACRFDPSTLACRDADGPLCLTRSQVVTVEKIYAGPRDPADGSSLFPGYAPGQETGTFGNPDRMSGFPEQFVANFVYGNAGWDPATFDLAKDAPAIIAAGGAGDASSTDFEAARKRGVKIIQYHGWKDLRIPPGNSTRYYTKVTDANGGLEATQDFYRLFMVPGMGHCYGDVGASAFGGVGQQLPPARDRSHDLVAALEAWVEQGVAPETFIATKYAGDKAADRSVLFQRRLCMYPDVPTYSGAGDPDSADSFVCRRPSP